MMEIVVAVPASAWYPYTVAGLQVEVEDPLPPPKPRRGEKPPMITHRIRLEADGREIGCLFQHPDGWACTKHGIHYPLMSTALCLLVKRHQAGRQS